MPLLKTMYFIVQELGLIPHINRVKRAVIARYRFDTACVKGGSLGSTGPGGDVRPSMFAVRTAARAVSALALPIAPRLMDFSGA
jgi:hypothetical protein